ncbi:cupin-like domain-containing protein [Streptomyces sp. NBRC 109706]|uniref:cupin-like domain-containing protein n=1 Tax=Streptomyces sp. NBRC 109706 TaxID=1550035 RepID=UPI0007821C20|nr:cupin-like domain-containing protein [Streptomyces sp. NBRC 109706]
MTSGIFRPPPSADGSLLAETLRGSSPTVFRGLAAEWPAVERWTFPYIGSLAPDLPVRLVVGNRESDPTRFTRSTLGSYAELLAGDEPGQEPVYLKEFDLLKEFPQLRDDLRNGELFPRGSITSCTTWIGPARARTGLHCDLLDNLAVVIAGRKRFWLAGPEAVARAGKTSAKYDAWARLSSVGAEELAADHPDAGDFYVVDLEPGDVLYVPARWWHEVVNLTSSVLLSGFFGPKTRVLSQWLAVQGREGLHRTGLLGRGNCTCHPGRATANA